MTRPIDICDGVQAEFVSRLIAAVRPSDVKPGEMRSLSEALALIGAVVFLKRFGIPFSAERMILLAQATIDGMERQTAVETN